MSPAIDISVPIWNADFISELSNSPISVFQNRNRTLFCAEPFSGHELQVRVIARRSWSVAFSFELRQHSSSGKLDYRGLWVRDGVSGMQANGYSEFPIFLEELPERKLMRSIMSRDYRFKNARRSFTSWSRCVANKPCGAPSYSSRVELGMAAAAARPVASIGTVLSVVPWMIKVGT